jgi:hypothetical protein
MLSTWDVPWRASAGGGGHIGCTPKGLGWGWWAHRMYPEGPRLGVEGTSELPPMAPAGGAEHIGCTPAHLGSDEG